MPRAFLVALLPLSSCGTLATTSDQLTRSGIEPAATRAELTDIDAAIREAVLRYQFTDSNSDACAVNFVRLDTGDPPPSFLARFRDCVVPVAPTADATVLEDAGPIDAVRHRHTGGKGCIFWVGTPHAMPNNRYEVEGSQYRGPRAACGRRYVVARAGEAWVVVDDQVRWNA